MVRLSIFNYLGKVFIVISVLLQAYYLYTSMKVGKKQQSALMDVAYILSLAYDLQPDTKETQFDSQMLKILQSKKYSPQTKLMIFKYLGVVICVMMVVVVGMLFTRATWVKIVVLAGLFIEMAVRCYPYSVQFLFGHHVVDKIGLIGGIFCLLVSDIRYMRAKKLQKKDNMKTDP